MLCIPTTGKSGTTSSWLDRLRSNKGFPPMEDNLDLDPTHNNDNTSLTAHESTLSNDRNRVVIDGRTSLELILSDLFNMGNCPIVSNRVKSSRKQANPRFCPPTTGNEVDDNSSGCARKDENALASTASLNSWGKDDGCSEENDGVEEGEWRGYSRSEVTVIDTSCEGWKFDKVVFRRKDVWKVRDKKGGRPNWEGGVVKKRKRSGLELARDDKKKKAKLLENDVQVQEQQDEQKEEVCKETPNDNGQFPKRRFHLSRSSQKSEKSHSSIIVIKDTPMNVKIGKNHHKNLHKE